MHSTPPNPRNPRYREQRRAAEARQRQVLLLVLGGLALVVGLVAAFLRRPEPTAVVPTPTVISERNGPTSSPRSSQPTTAAGTPSTPAPVGAGEPSVSQASQPTASRPADDFFDPQRFSYEPNFNGPEIQAYLETQAGPLKGARFQVGNRSQSFTDVLVGMSSLFSFNPKIMLALIEQQSRLLSTAQPSSDQFALALGFSGEGRRGLISQLRWGGIELRRAVRDYPSATTLTFADGSTQPYHASSFNRYALARLLAQTTTPGQLDAKLNAFLDTYTRLFGDPRSVPVDWPAPAAPFLHWPMDKPARVTSFFDHDTPFLRENGSLVSYWGRTEKLLSYDGHTGWDFAEQPPDPALAAAAGSVIFAGNSDDGCGIAHAVILDHGNGYRTLYWHLDSIDVQAGQQVTAGQQIGVVGSTGCATGPHLHFQVQYLGRDVDPYGWCGGATPDPWAAYPGGQTSVWLWADWPSPCAPAPPGVVVVDNGSPGFASSGAWQSSPLGYGGTALFAASQTSTDSAPYALQPLESPAVAVWRPTLPHASRYHVLAYVPYFLNGQEDAQIMTFHVRFAGGETDVQVDATVLANEWADLGTYTFDPLETPQVSIGSTADENGRSVWADAVAWVPAKD